MVQKPPTATSVPHLQVPAVNTKEFDSIIAVARHPARKREANFRRTAKTEASALGVCLPSSSSRKTRTDEMMFPPAVEFESENSNDDGDEAEAEVREEELTVRRSSWKSLLSCCCAENTSSPEYKSVMTTNKGADSIHYVASKKQKCRKMFLISIFLGIVVMFTSYELGRQYFLSLHDDKPVLFFRYNEEPPTGALNKTKPYDYKFKILQIADIHLGEEEGRDWGIEHDHKTFQALDKFLKYEEDVDLIVLTGDQITSNNCYLNCTEYYKILGDFLTSYEIPWAMIFGNHEVMSYKTMSMNYSLPSQHTREDLVDVLKQYKFDLTQAGPTNLFGTTNYVLNVHLPSTTTTTTEEEEEATGTSNVGAQIYLFDTGGGELPQKVEQNQIDWFHQKRQEMDIQVPAVAFQHIPTAEFDYHDGTGGNENVENSNNDATGTTVISDNALTNSNVRQPSNTVKKHTETEGSCHGYDGDYLTPLQDGDAGIVQALLDSRNVHFLAVGHDHGNDYCCPYYSSSNNDTKFHVCFGRHSGYGGYGHWDRGVRVYELRLNVERNNDDSVIRQEEMAMPAFLDLTWESWVRLESGEVISQISSSES